MGSLTEELGAGFGTLLGGIGVGFAKYFWLFLLLIGFIFVVHRYYKDRALREEKQKSIFQIYAENLEMTIQVNYVKGIDYIMTKGTAGVITPIVLGKQAGIIFNGNLDYNKLNADGTPNIDNDNNLCYIGFKPKNESFIFKIPILKDLIQIFKPKPYIIQCMSKDIEWDYPNKRIMLKCNNIIWDEYWFDLVRGRNLTHDERTDIKNQVEDNVYKQGWKQALSLGVTNTKMGAQMNAQVNLETRLNTETQTNN